MQDELRRLWLRERKTVVLVTHDVDEAVYLSERVVVIGRGDRAAYIEDFKIAVDREGGREPTVLSAAFTRLRNEVWLSVRRQVGPGIYAWYGCK